MGINAWPLLFVHDEREEEKEREREREESERERERERGGGEGGKERNEWKVGEREREREALQYHASCIVMVCYYNLTYQFTEVWYAHCLSNTQFF